MPEMLDATRHLESTTLGVFRTSATVKGGRRFSFGALVVVGNRNGRVGYGHAKGKEVPNAVEKAQKYAERAIIEVPRIGTTIFHEVECQHGACKVRLIPASPGSGVIAGGLVRNVLELAGIADCLTKVFGNTNPVNVIKACFGALEMLRTPDHIASARGVKLERTIIEDKIERGRAFMPATRSSDRAKGPVNTIGQDRQGGRGGRGGPGRGGPRGGRGGGHGGGGAHGGGHAPDAAPAGAPTEAPPAQP